MDMGKQAGAEKREVLQARLQAGETRRDEITQQKVEAAAMETVKVSACVPGSVSPPCACILVERGSALIRLGRRPP